jgi:hypothetical protein
MFHNLFPKLMLFMRYCGNIWWGQTDYRQTHNMKFRLLFHGNNGYANAPSCYVVRVYLHTVDKIEQHVKQRGNLLANL